MVDKKLARKLIKTLPHGLDDLFNPWVDSCPEDINGNGPKQKITRLAEHLDCRPKYILCGEAPGYQGCRHSGIAFTSERLLLEGKIPRIGIPTKRLTSRDLPFSEPSATIIWKALYNLGIAESTILWNALQMHPLKEGDIRTNRTPTLDELALGEPAIKILLKAFPKAKLIAVGKKAEGLLGDMGVATVGSVRHPANGGATKFFDGMSEIVKKTQGKKSRAVKKASV